MRLRITTEPGPEQTVVRVDGELVNEGVSELEKVCSKIAHRLSVDLGGLDRLDPDGVRCLHALADRGAHLLGANPYIALLLQGYGDGP